MKSPLRLSTFLIAFSVVLLGWPTLAGAQQSDEDRLVDLRQQLREAEEQVNKLRAELYSSDATRELARARRDEARVRQYARVEDRYADLLMTRAGTLALMPQRARLGVTVRTRADEDTAGIGAVLEEVTPDGPADEASLESGDIVTHWNGTSLLEAVPRSDEAERAGVLAYSDSAATSVPAARLIARARQLEPGETVELTYLRDSEEHTVAVTASAMPAPPLAPMPPAALSAPRAPRAPRVRDYLFVALGGPWGDMEVVSVGKELGEYFGTERGLLVVVPPSEDPFGLRPGDVILSIGDREPRDLSHALRILRSYESEESINLNTRRKGKSVTLTGELPESSSRFGWIDSAPVVPPAPPAPPL